MASKAERPSEVSAADNENDEDEFRVPIFDVKLFEKKSKIPIGYLTLEAKTILGKEPNERSEDDLNDLEDEVQSMEFFSRFPYTLVRDVCKVLQYQECSTRQLVLKEGHDAKYMYVIVAGCVKVVNTVKGEKTGRNREVTADQLSHGMAFGVGELLHGTKRTCSIRCKSPTELVKLDKANFDRYLKDLLLRDENLIKDKLKSHPTLAEFEFKDEDINSVHLSCKIGKFPADHVIIGGTDDVPYYVHFIINGQCAIEQEVEFTVEYKRGYNRLRPVPKNISSQPDIKISKKRLEICRLDGGHYFGMGEDMKQRYVRCLEQLETLMIPRIVLLQKHLRIFDKLRDQLEQSFPSIQFILDKHMEVLKWEKFKTDVANQVSINKNLEKITKKKGPFIKYV